jgi:hypothetical protein
MLVMMMVRLGRPGGTRLGCSRRLTVHPAAGLIVL